MNMKKIIPLAAIAASLTSLPSHAKNEALETYGDIAQIGIPLTAAMISWYKDDTEGLIQLTEGALYNALATHAIKFAVNAERPNGGNHSFPSGHTSAATQGAAYLQFRYGSAYGIPAYGAAALVGYSRVDANHHYWRDVIAGMALATGVQYAVTELGYSVTVLPYFTGEETGVTAQVRF
ncbi:PAP2 family phosphoesterase [Vibrio nigripulchritudo]|nr:PAP2 family phosphoesterase [Vibrio nigripulchritudo]BDU41255.1 PAP2 family phosphoesterase [Vibrio nigripulchritudo]